MYHYPLSLAISFVALALVSFSYLVKKKRYYLFLQALACLCLVFSYFFVTEFFAMVSIFVGLLRTLIYYAYEKNDKHAPPLVVAAICFVTVSVYFIINVGVLSTWRPLDVLYVLSLCMYAIVFSIRNLYLMKWLVIIPHVLAILYNVMIFAPPFTVLSYSAELFFNLYSLCLMTWERRQSNRRSSMKAQNR